MTTGARTFSPRNLGGSLSLGRDKLTIRYTGHGQGARRNDVGCLQATLAVPLWLTVDYYEVKVIDRGQRCFIGVGFASPQFEINKQPGWTSDSYGYHGDDGMAYHCSEMTPFGPTFETGDVIGAGFNYITQEIFFTRNGRNIGAAFRGVAGVLIPTVGLHSWGEVVEANFGQRPFAFNIEALRAVQSRPKGFPRQTVGNSLLVAPDKRTLMFVGSQGAEVGAIQADQAVPRGQASYYYEVTIKNRGLCGYIGIGFASPDYPQDRQPGWARSSYGYHGDDGKKYYCTRNMTECMSEFYGPTFATRDVIGAGINYASGGIYFTKNGRYLGTAFTGVEAGMIPTVGLHSQGEEVEVNFGERPFLFDGIGLRLAEGEPAKFSDRNASRLVEVFHGDRVIRYTGRDGYDVAAVQANQLVPTWHEIYYYEVKVLDRGRHAYIGVGFAKPGFPTDKQPGWTSTSYGYHGDDGLAYHHNSGVPYSSTFTTGDVIGAGFNPTTCEIFFTKNGRFLGTAFEEVEGDLVPTVGLHSPGESVEANFGQQPFMFDLQQMIVQAAASRQTPIASNADNYSMPVSPGAAQSTEHSRSQSYSDSDLQHTRECDCCKKRSRPAVTLSACGHSLDATCGMLHGALGFCFCGARFSEAEMRACNVDQSPAVAHLLEKVRASLLFSQEAAPPASADATNTTGDGGPGLSPEKACVVCMTEDKNTAFVPCGHVACCVDCAAVCAASGSGSCPVCRAEIRQTMRIYF